MKIIAVSDLHGNLIKIKDECDVFVIAGDWSPLQIQSINSLMTNWVTDEFIPWMMELNAKHVILIPGNHDFICTTKKFRSDFLYSITKMGLHKKIHYLCNESVVIDDKKFYGMPNNESPNGWAFSKTNGQSYDFEADTDILITHQPPMIGDVGFVSKYNKDLGSRELRNKLLDSVVSLNICGHIHTGSHLEHIIRGKKGNLISVFNVSILDEDYDIAYNPTIIEIK